MNLMHVTCPKGEAIHKFENLGDMNMPRHHACIFLWLFISKPGLIQAELESLERVGEPRFSYGEKPPVFHRLSLDLGPGRIHRCERWICSSYEYVPNMFFHIFVIEE